jgi:hypothetical protein
MTVGESRRNGKDRGMGKRATNPPTETPEEWQKRCIDTACAAVATSDKGLKRICDALRENDTTFPAQRTIRTWMDESEEYKAQYARAKEAQADFIFEQILDIADDDSDDELFTEDGKRVLNSEFVQRSKLKIEARKWVVSKLLPKKYGDKIEQTLQNPDGSSLNLGLTVVFGKEDDQG